MLPLANSGANARAGGNVGVSDGVGVICAPAVEVAHAPGIINTSINVAADAVNKPTVPLRMTLPLILTQPATYNPQPTAHDPAGCRINAQA
jgi:hypothetical protein